MSIDLTAYGLEQNRKKIIEERISKKSNLYLGRVVSVHRKHYEVVIENDFVIAELRGKRIKNKDPYSKPLVGDWVLLSLDESHTVYMISEILERKTILKRRKNNSKKDIQLIAANVDTAVIVQSLDQDFNVRRLERNLIQLRDTGIRPVIVLNKTDLVEDLNNFKKEMESLDVSIPVFYSSLPLGQGLKDMEELLNPGETIVFIGSSGVGKTSLINTMLDEHEQQKTREISDYSGKGKHTTTVRKLFLLDKGAIVIDTPGVREFGLSLDEKDVIEEQFTLIHSYADSCKFNNCKHMSEPECAVKDAVVKGDLDEEILRHYHKLNKEVDV